MRIVVHGQQAFGKAVLEALLQRGENVIAVYVAPEKPGQKADPLKEAALAAPWRAHRRNLAQGAQVLGQGSRRHHGLRRNHAAGEAGQGGGGVTTAVVPAQAGTR